MALSSTQRSSMGGGNVALSAYLEDHVGRMQQEIEVVTRKLEIEKRRLHLLEENYRRSKDEYDEKRLKYNLRRAAEEDEVQRGRSKVRQLENRLEKALAKLNGQLDYNLKLRSAIDQQRRERVTLDAVVKKLSREVTNVGDQLKDLSNEMDETKNTQTMTAARIHELRKLRDEERVDFKHQCNDLHVEMRSTESKMKEWEIQQRKTHAAQNALLRGQSTQQMSESTPRKGGTKKDEKKDEKDKKSTGPPPSPLNTTRSTFVVAEEEEGFNQEGMMKEILKTAFLNTIQRRHIKQHQKNIEVFEQAFETIKSSTGIADIEEIVKIFMKVEERNFSLLSYANQLNRDIEAMELRTRELDTQLKDSQVADEEAFKRKRQALEELELQIAKTKEAADQKDLENEKQHGITLACKPIVEKLTKVVQEAWGDPLGPPEMDGDNFLPLLYYIERFVAAHKDYLPGAETISVLNETGVAATGLEALSVSGAQRGSVVSPPLTGARRVDKVPSPGSAGGAIQLRPGDLPSSNLQGEDDSDEEDLADRPLTNQELKERSLQAIAKKKKSRGRAGNQDAPTWSPGAGVSLGEYPSGALAGDRGVTSPFRSADGERVEDMRSLSPEEVEAESEQLHQLMSKTMKELDKVLDVMPVSSVLPSVAPTGEAKDDEEQSPGSKVLSSIKARQMEKKEAEERLRQAALAEQEEDDSPIAWGKAKAKRGGKKNASRGFSSSDQEGQEQEGPAMSTIYSEPQEDEEGAAAAAAEEANLTAEGGDEGGKEGEPDAAGVGEEESG
ncbi:unnamed protein product [Vitrella brassicaformis CCMP3155]|uniref:ODAD1 central coiled coil region domain-containing protein n=2 Tax=Vitrella brassicaformis TaxID=1169539 RepID=A0A0G4FXW9_VITBC|nr:unnamed protein product [Vitrella brassicaformis CCMP3155]|eukprot:CEM19959.1 unnamed protein product [Vitrella brassicaformis CCMP3155]